MQLLRVTDRGDGEAVEGIEAGKADHADPGLQPRAGMVSEVLCRLALRARQRIQIVAG